MSENAKTIADVADKALDNVSGAIGSMVDALKKVAPHAWEIMVRNHALSGAVYSTIYLVLIIIGALTIKGMSKRWDEKEPRRDVLTDTAVLCRVLGFCTALGVVAVATLCLPESIMEMANPEYYAIKELLKVGQ